MAETKEDIQQQLKEALRQLTDTKHELDTTKLDLQSVRDALTAATAEKNELQTQLIDERQRSGEAAGELNEAQTLIEDLQKRLDRADARQAQSDTVIVSDGEHDYKVLAPKFKFEHVTYEATTLQKDEALVKRLVEAGVGFLHKIEAEA